ncbi:transcriptional regulator, HxlR family [Paenibacillus uliginis N3/975]|uniref:Transcriptional regulator, HxlR family n=1 Tax=Paenibacillus uliginis N3/975 TaxID=1313296 RepID=A0A1X7G5E3_9BACL|nr:MULTISPECIES: helix-turn-helix domain-containing protein [Paenibacillus]UNK18338.1 helix-turn-helix transcriptional regulator [Paenibacillus sp. N3/727]SMF64221.1 transcriptional regulator, HxlR family [Paenibacillus uliginis N3/975]
MVSDKCPIEVSIEVLGGKWKPFILYYLLNGTKRFSELQRYIPSVSPKVLTQQLRDLEEDGIIVRHVYPIVPPKVEYSLTTYGESIRPVIDILFNWGTSHLELSRIESTCNHKLAKVK